MKISTAMYVPGTASLGAGKVSGAPRREKRRGGFALHMSNLSRQCDHFSEAVESHFSHVEQSAPNLAKGRSQTETSEVGLVHGHSQVLWLYCQPENFSIRDRH